jgi:hypothetical protein
MTWLTRALTRSTEARQSDRSHPRLIFFLLSLARLGVEDSGREKLRPARLVTERAQV